MTLGGECLRASLKAAMPFLSESGRGRKKTKSSHWIFVCAVTWLEDMTNIQHVKN